MNYYNELDPYAAQWIRNLIAKGLIPDGKVDERDIKKVKAKEVQGYIQAHFFAGIAGWSRALQLAGWPEDEEVWTGSCPCQPFSIAGKGKGKKDKRHLWPVWRRLIATCLPATIFGEQVVSPMGRDWLAEVRFDLEHIYYWTAFYENLYTVRQAERKDCLPKILGKIVRRVEAVVRRVSAHIRAKVAQASEGISSEGTPKTSGKGQALPLALQRYSCCQLPSVQVKATCPQEGTCFRSRSASSKTPETYGQTGVRNDGHSAKDSQGAKRSAIRFPLFGPNQSAEGLCIYEYSHRLLRNERTSWKLGKKKSEESCSSVDKEGELNVERAITNRFGVLIEASVKRLRSTGIQSQMEALGYEVGAADLCASGIGAPHLRQRLFWVADSSRERQHGQPVRLLQRKGRQAGQVPEVAGAGGAGGLVNAKSGRTMSAEQQGPLSGCQQAGSGNHRLGNASGGKLAGRKRKAAQKECSAVERASSTGASFWRNYELVHCADGKARRIESCSFPLAFKLPRSVGQNKSWLEAMGLLAKAAEALTGAKRNRIGRLKGYGNAIVAPLAAEFITAYLETRRLEK